jgi:hypothetical protein
MAAPRESLLAFTAGGAPLPMPSVLSAVKQLLTLAAAEKRGPGACPAAELHARCVSGDAALLWRCAGARTVSLPQRATIRCRTRQPPWRGVATGAAAAWCRRRWQLTRAWLRVVSWRAWSNPLLLPSLAWRPR